jgi:pimeloyl-ACP methyl ester carboxylesterase
MTRSLEVEGAGPTILLLHGFSDSADSFRPLLQELADRRRHAVAVDLPGFGMAGPLGRPALESLDDFATDLARRYADKGEVLLVGNSMGGLVALRAAVRGDLPLAAVAGLGPGGLAYHRRLETFARLASCLDPILGLLDRLPVPAPVVRWTTRTLYDRRLARGKADAELGHLYATHLGDMRRLGTLRRNLLALTADDTRLGSQALSRIRVPVLLIWGDKDRLADINGAGTLLEAVPDSRLVTLENCGHCPQIETPDTVADLLAGLPDTALRDSRGDRESLPERPKRTP